MTDQRTHPTGPDHAGEESMAIGPGYTFQP